MRRVLITIALVLSAAPASAQGSVIDRARNQVDDLKRKRQALEALVITDAEERRIGENISARLRQRFGVVQDRKIHRYVTLVGTLAAQQSMRPSLAWTFIVLDTDGVNAFAAPGGYIHVTRGLLAMLRNEAELAAVVAHEIAHVDRRHTINAMRKKRAADVVTDKTLGNRSALLQSLADVGYSEILENKFDRNDEIQADVAAFGTTQALGYASTSLGKFLRRLDERNANQPRQNGLFASHPETKARLAALGRLATSATARALVQSRYASAVPYKPVAVESIAVVTEAVTPTEGAGAPADDAAESEARPRVLGIPLPKGLRDLPGMPPAEEPTVVVASAGARGVGADRYAKGGDNPRLVKVAVSADEVAAFRKGIR